jgi:hypothetical protein
MLNVGEQENSTAVQFLKGRGVTKDSVYAQVLHTSCRLGVVI